MKANGNSLVCAEKSKLSWYVILCFTKWKKLHNRDGDNIFFVPWFSFEHLDRSDWIDPVMVSVANLMSDW